MAKKKVFVVEDRVGQCDNYDEDGKLHFHPDSELYFGVVSKVLTDDKVMVKWDDKYMSSDYPVDTSDLFHEEELKEKFSKLEAKFKEVESKVKESIKLAAKSLLDAQKIAKAAGLDLSELYDAVAPLESAMDKCGWQTSSLHC